MITLRKNEQVEIYQVELALKEKTKQNPFIAVLILAKEQDEITAESLQQNLLPTLPIRACNNLLLRLEQQGYLLKKRNQIFRNDTWGHSRFDYKEAQDDYRKTVFTLTDFGEQSAINKSFWIGEKGVYNIYVNKKMFDDGFTPYHILKIEKSKILEDDRKNDLKRVNVPQTIYAYKDVIELKLQDKEIRIEEIENTCFQLNPENCSFEIEAKGDESFFKILKDKQTLFQSLFETSETELKDKLLINSHEFEYDENKKVVLSEFNQENLSLNRKIKLKNPYFQGNQFNSVEIENIAFIPKDKQNAELWLNEILFKGIDKYFLEENSFNEFVTDKAKPILAYYSIELPTRKQLKQTIEKKENSFYQTAKLEAIDYLNY